MYDDMDDYEMIWLVGDKNNKCFMRCVKFNVNMLSLISVQW